MGDRITISDVARRAGVSTGTVSAVINGRDTVRPRTRDKVLRVVSELGYRPALSARALASAGRRPSPYAAGVGVIVKEADNPFYTEVVSGIHETLRRHNLLALASATDGVFQTEGQAIEALRAMTVQGLIIGPVLHEEVDLEHLFALVRIRFPFVLLETVQGLRASSVSIDNVDGSKRAVAHLFEHGHRRVVHFSGPPYTQHTRDRIQGVREAFSESDQVFDPACIVPAGARVHDGYRTAKEYFAEAGDDRPTALTC
ncbi:MAG: LacI family DNA-binding transcriptional regulator, partial [Bacteroidota bacterium]